MNTIGFKDLLKKFKLTWLMEYLEAKYSISSENDNMRTYIQQRTLEKDRLKTI